MAQGLGNVEAVEPGRRALLQAEKHIGVSGRTRLARTSGQLCRRCAHSWHVALLGNDVELSSIRWGRRAPQDPHLHTDEVLLLPRVHPAKPLCASAAEQGSAVSTVASAFSPPVARAGEAARDDLQVPSGADWPRCFEWYQ